jgi:hypothetical protein
MKKVISGILNITPNGNAEPEKCSQQPGIVGFFILLPFSHLFCTSFVVLRIVIIPSPAALVFINHVPLLDSGVRAEVS